MIAPYLAALALVSGLAAASIALLRIAKTRGIQMPGNPIRIMARRPLGPSASLVLIEVDARRLLVSVSRSGIALIDTLPACTTADIIPFDTSFSAILRRASR